eukprot:s3301_g5.t1
MAVLPSFAHLLVNFTNSTKFPEDNQDFLMTSSSQRRKRKYAEEDPFQLRNLDPQCASHQQNSEPLLSGDVEADATFVCASSTFPKPRCVNTNPVDM